MTIQKALDYIKSLKKQNQGKKALHTIETFMSLLEDLQSKNLTKLDEEKIEKQLSDLQLNTAKPTDNKRLKKALRVFISFLQKSFAFTVKNYYTGLYMSLGISLGMSLGMGIGIAFGMPMGLVFGMIIGMMVGMCIGVVLGIMKDAIAEREDRILYMK